MATPTEERPERMVMDSNSLEFARKFTERAIEILSNSTEEGDVFVTIPGDPSMEYMEELYVALHHPTVAKMLLENSIIVEMGSETAREVPNAFRFYFSPDRVLH